MYKSVKNIVVVLTVFTVCIMSGCTTTEYIPFSKYIAPPKGLYHKVQTGETIWRIAKIYDVSIDEIVKANKIPNAAYIEPDQLIFIPDKTERKAVILDENSLYPNEFSWPLKGKIISYFGQSTKSGINYGVDIQARSGDTVYSSRGGKVVFTDTLSGHAKTIIIDHEDGYLTVYSQNSSIMVKVGDYIAKGIPIAQVGESSRLAFLHFEIRRNDTADNPLYYLP